MSSEVFVTLVPFGIFFAAASIAYAMRRLSWWIVAVPPCIFSLLLIAMVWHDRHQGFAGIALAIVIIFAILPAFGGTLTGSLFGIYSLRKSRLKSASRKK
jgi:hypothetical protein